MRFKSFLSKLSEEFKDIGKLSPEKLKRGLPMVTGQENFIKVTGRVYHQAINRIRQNDIAKLNKNLPSKGLNSLHVYDVKDYMKMNCFLGKNNSSGYCIKPDGELVSVFSSQGSSGNALMDSAVKNGAKYLDCKTNYKGQGVDQLARVIKTIKEDPGSRRIILSAYNVADLDKMVLNPCHCMVQFYVDTVRGELSAQMYQRSADLFLGVPINIASYALLTHLIAHVCKLGVGKLTICYGDAHIYKNHLEQVKEQLSRRDRVKPFPKLKILRVVDNIEDFTLDDIAIVGYEHEARIKAPMAV